jgi:hypothetical protein
MGMGDMQLLRAVDEVATRLTRVHDAFRDANDVVAPLLVPKRRGAMLRARAIAGARSDAAVAEQLLGSIVREVPGIAPALDAVRAARAVQGMRRPTLAPVSHVRMDLEREGRALEAWKHVRGMDRDARIAALDRFRSTTADTLTQDEWKTLAGIIGDDVDGTLTDGLPTTMGTGLPIRDLALNAAYRPDTFGNRSSRFFVGHSYFDAWQASQLPVDARRARIDELLSGDPHARTREEWRELAGLLNAGGHDVLDHPWFPGTQPGYGARHAMLGGYDVIERLGLDATTASAPQLEVARRQLLAPGELDDLARSIVQRDQLDAVGITGAEADAVRLRHLEPTHPQAARLWLDAIADAMQRTPVDGSVAPLRDGALDLVRRNVARIDGDRWWRPFDGYANHPDYAELGRVRSTWQLIEQLAAPAETAAARAPDTLVW